MDNTTFQLSGLGDSIEDPSLPMKINIAEEVQGPANAENSDSSFDCGKEKKCSGAAKKRALKAKLAERNQTLAQNCEATPSTILTAEGIGESPKTGGKRPRPEDQIPPEVKNKAKKGLCGPQTERFV